MDCLVVAHRGASAYAPENTLASFRKAMEMGTDFVELDVHVSADDELVVIHDENVDRTTNGWGLVGEKTVSELKSLDAGGGEWVPTLEEVIDELDGKTRLYIEVKIEDIEEKLINLLTEEDLLEEVIVSSFNQSVVKNLKGLNPELKTGILFDAYPVPFTSLAQSLNADVIHPCSNNLREEDVITAHQENFEIITWATDSPAEMCRLVSYGVDGICTNKPDVLRKIVDNHK